jgi:hypothetical protein
MTKNKSQPINNKAEILLSLEIIGGVLGGIIIMGIAGLFLLKWYTDWKYMRSIERTQEVRVNELYL